MRSAYRRRRPGLTTLLDQLRKLREEIAGVVWTGRGFRVVLDTENRQLAMPHAFHGSVIQIDVRDLHLFRERFGIDGEAVVLRRDRNLSAPQILDRLVPAAMSELQLERAPADREPKNL